VSHDIPERFSLLEDALASRRRTGLLRTLEHHRPEGVGPYIVRGEERLLNFSSNDYLGLAMDLQVRTRSARYAESFGGGATASRLVVGGFEIHADLERYLAEFTGRESALLFSSGYLANVTILPALAGRNGLILCDRMCHNSLIQGALLSRARVQRFRHNDLGHLEELLNASEARKASPILIVTESIFSMDGDRAPLAEIGELAEAHGAFFMVDDAHALGVWGAHGEGLAAAHPRVDLLLGTFGKSLGSAGAFVACAEVLRSYLINFCGGVIYTTAPAPGTVGAAEAALDAIRSGGLNLPGYHRKIESAHNLLRTAGFDTSPSISQIVPIQLGGEEAALSSAAYLRSKGILAVAIRPPTVPIGSSRLRVSVTRLHTEAHLSELLSALEGWRREGGG
jgi:8-amino-7-oxononanoate synthase